MKTLNMILSMMFLSLVAHGQGIIVQHSGANNPTNEGFTYDGTAGAVGPVVNDMGFDAWTTSTTNLSGPPPSAAYNLTLTPQQQAELAGVDWDLSLTLRIVQSPNATQNAFVDIQTGSAAIALSFGAETNGDPFIAAGGIPQFILSGAGSTYNNYQIIYNAETTTVDVWVNGVDQFTLLTSGFSPTPEISWGESQGAGIANWSLVSLEIIPEPSSISLILLVSGVLFYVRRTYKKN